MANQYAVIVEEATPGTDPGSGYLFPPVKGKIDPEPDFSDKVRDEYRGNDTRLGPVDDSRVSTSWKHPLEQWLYPIKEQMVQLKHVLGFAGTRVVHDTSGYKGIMYPPAAFPYGVGGALYNKRLGYKPNTDKDGTTVSQYLGGGIAPSAKFEIKRPDDVSLTVELAGGPWVGAAGQAATAGASFTTYNPYNSGDVTCYCGSGISRTGSAPDFTDIGPGTMNAFSPDSLSIEIGAGLELVDKINGLKGPSVPEVANQVSAKINYTMDFTDPAAGFSSYDEYVAYMGGVLYHSYFIKLVGLDNAGASVKHQMFFDLPRVKMTVKITQRDSTGKPAKAEFTGESRYDATAKYPIAIMTIDKVSAY